MQTPERLIAYQLFPLEGYQRLRAALMQQRHLFKSVVTDAQMPDKDVWMSAIAQSLFTAAVAVGNVQGQARRASNGSASNGSAGNGSAEGGQIERFQLATQSLHQLSSLATNQAESIAQPQGSSWQEMLEKGEAFAGGDRAAVSHDPGLEIAPDSQNFVLMCSPSLNVLLTAVPVARSTRDADSEYQVGLTFDDGAIAAFLAYLQESVIENENVRRLSVEQRPASHQPASRQSASHQPVSHQLEANPPGSPPRSFHPNSSQKPFQGLPQMSHSPMPFSAPGRDPSHHSPKASANEKIMAQKSFVLSWAKHLATSPEGEVQPTQATLDNQIEQSLLLDQVITKIRHSLDLSSILETTVAQVRAFLSADRLVLYQLDHFDPVRVPLEDATQSAVNRSAEHVAASASPSQSGETTVKAETGLDMNPIAQAAIGQSVHSAHVTYESRISEDIVSVLNFSEEECFNPARLMKTRYLMGEPIAIDNVDEKYAQVDCLLAFLHHAQVKSKIIAPIVVQDRLWGLIIAHQCETHRHWEKTETVFLQHIAEHLAVAISQASLYQQVREQTVSLQSCVIERTQNLHDALIAAESANVTKGEFLSTMSHELKTPLTYIIGMSSTLLRWSFGGLNSRQRSYLTTINQSGEKLLTIINNILEFANVESGRSLLDFSDLSLSALINTIVSHHQEMADEQGVTLVCDFRVSPKQDAFRADAKRLQQIISNLVDNAIKFTPAGGQVNLRVWRESQLAVFQVEDSGIGIPESQQDILFEKFKQLESPFQRQYSGTGLGLAMTKRLVELHSGSIHVDSQVGKGSTFSVRLPTQPETLPPQRYQIPATFEGNVERVILLEADDDNAAIVCEMLTAAGYEVIWLIDSHQLTVQLDVLRPVMLVADLALLSQDLDAIKSIQLSITALNAKVLALVDQQGGVPSLMAHHDILHKPIDPKVLLEKVQQLTSKPA